MNPLKRQKSKLAFTLIEIIIFLALSSVMVFLVFISSKGQRDKFIIDDSLRQYKSILETIQNEASSGLSYSTPEEEKNFKCNQDNSTVTCNDLADAIDTYTGRTQSLGLAVIIKPKNREITIYKLKRNEDSSTDGIEGELNSSIRVYGSYTRDLPQQLDFIGYSVPSGNGTSFYSAPLMLVFSQDPPQIYSIAGNGPDNNIDDLIKDSKLTIDAVNSSNNGLLESDIYLKTYSLYFIDRKDSARFSGQSGGRASVLKVVAEENSIVPVADGKIP